ncbi:MAG: glycosyltransferase family 2 protein, partial [Elusimicrobiales bacterium]|nr:glycosyltransferase family 2 protein [Elusimicrobiales bacterium]
MKPKISVVIPTHNRPDRVKRAIQSVLNQTFQDFEIIVVDDGVKERAEQAVKSFNDPRIKYIQHSKNQG